MWTKIVFGLWIAAAGADNVSTYHALQSPLITEQNVTLAPLRDHPAWLSVALAGEDAGYSVLTWRVVRPRHPKLAIALLIGSTAFRGYLTVRNVQHLHEAQALPAFVPR